METHLFASPFLSGKVQTLHDDAVHVIFDGCIHDELRGLYRDVIIDTSYFLMWL